MRYLLRRLFLRLPLLRPELPLATPLYSRLVALP